MPASQRKRKKKQEIGNQLPEDKEPKKVSSRFAPRSRRRIRPLSFVVGVFLIMYIMLYCYVQPKENDLSGIYNVLWLCNSSLLIAAIGMISQHDRLIGLSIALVAFSHLSFMFDLFYWLLTDTFQIGRAHYIEDTKFNELWFLTLHQIWFIPISLCVLYVDYRPHGIPGDSWAYATVVNLLMASVAFVSFRFMTTDNFSQNDKRYFIYNFNTGHEFWTPNKDSMNIVHRFDSASYPVYISWSLFVESVLLNGSCFIFLKIFSFLVLEDITVKLKSQREKQK